MKRFWNKVKKTEDCWLWIGSNNGSGYGEIRIEGKKVYAHRWSYQNTYGPIPRGLVLDHLCRNPSCVRPTHLQPVTPKENTRRGIGIGRKKKTECVMGHDLKNAYIRKDGKGRNCRECNLNRVKAYQDRQHGK